MTPDLQKRSWQRGNSFTSCLLTVVVIFGGLGFYYFKYFQWRDLEDPLRGITYVKVKDAPQLNDFRKQTVKQISDPTKQQLDRLATMRKETKKGTVKYEELEQECSEVRNRLKVIMSEAKLRRIPKDYEKPYGDVLKALGEGYKSVNYLEKSFDQETPAAKEKMYGESIKASKEGLRLAAKGRDFFHSGYRTF